MDYKYIFLVSLYNIFVLLHIKIVLISLKLCNLHIFITILIFKKTMRYYNII